MTKIKDIEKVNSLYKDLIELDTEIIKLEQLAILASKADLGSQLVINYINVPPNKEDNKKNIFDEHGFIKKKFLDNKQAADEIKTRDIGNGLFELVIPQAFREIYMKGEKSVGQPEQKLEIKIKESTLMIILEQLIFEKKKQRRQIIDSLKILGVTI